GPGAQDFEGSIGAIGLVLFPWIADADNVARNANYECCASSGGGKPTRSHSLFTPCRCCVHDPRLTLVPVAEVRGEELCSGFPPAVRFAERCLVGFSTRNFQEVVPGHGCIHGGAGCLVRSSPARSSAHRFAPPVLPDDPALDPTHQVLP